MLNDFYNLAVGHVPTAIVMMLFLLSLLCEISKLPLNPWKYIGRLLKSIILGLGDIMTGNLREQLSAVIDRLNEIEVSQKTERKNNVRRSILKFADECRVGTKHSKEMFINVMTDIDEYMELCHDTDDPNSVIEEAICYIKEINHECLVENSYL